MIKGGELPTRVAELGVEPAEVTDVVLTHLHPDHYGWATHDAGRRVPEGDFRCHALDWDHFVVQPGARLSGWSPDSSPSPNASSVGITTARFFPGSTFGTHPGTRPAAPCSCCSSGSERALLLGDTVHCPVQLLEAEWASLGDVDQDLAVRTRDALRPRVRGHRRTNGRAPLPRDALRPAPTRSGRRYWN